MSVYVCVRDVSACVHVFARACVCMEARRPVRDGGVGGGGRVGKEGQKSETSKQAPTRKTKAVVDRRQNNRMLKQCPSGFGQRL